jgi:hypothetical protein
MRLKYQSNKKTFSHHGVILECRDGAIRICHIPHCGMAPKTAEMLATWLERRAWDIRLKREPITAGSQPVGEK